MFSSHSLVSIICLGIAQPVTLPSHTTGAGSWGMNREGEKKNWGAAGRYRLIMAVMPLEQTPYLPFQIMFAQTIFRRGPTLWRGFWQGIWRTYVDACVPPRWRPKKYGGNSCLKSLGRWRWCLNGVSPMGRIIFRTYHTYCHTYLIYSRARTRTKERKSDLKVIAFALQI